VTQVKFIQAPPGVQSLVEEQLAPGTLDNLFWQIPLTQLKEGWQNVLFTILHAAPS